MLYSYFISGHRDLTEQEFDQHYVPLLDKLLAAEHAGKQHKVFIGDAPGADSMACAYLVSNGFAKHRIGTFCKGDTPRNHTEGCFLITGFASHTERDVWLTASTDYDIAWVRPGKETSGTAMNKARRRNVVVHKV